MCTRVANTSGFGTPNAAVTAGDTLVVIVSMAGDSHVTSIVSTDGSGDTWTVIPGAHGYDSNAGSIDIAYSQNIAAGTNGAFGTMTTTSGNTFVGECTFEVTGVPTTGQLVDCAASQDITDPNTTTFVTPPCTTTEPNELILGVAEGLYDGDTTVPEGGITFTPIDGAPDGNGIYGDPGGVYNATATGTYVAGLVSEPASTGTSAIVSFIGAGQLAAPTSLQVTPASANLMIGGTQAFTAVDQNGTPRPDATWSINDTSVANFVEGSANTLSGLAAGQTTITATIGSLSAQAQVTVLSGPLTPGTALWSAPAVPGFSGEFQSTIVQAVPSDGGPDVYSVDADSSGDVLVRAFHSDGEQKWQHLISGAFTPLQTFYTAMGDGAGGVLISSATSQQEGGGGGCITTSAVLTSYIFDLNGMNGSQNWEYATGPESGIGHVAVGPDGTVYAVESGNSVCTDAYFNNTQGFLDRISGQTGALVSRTALPVSTSQSTCDAPNPPVPWFPNPYDLTVAGSYGPLMVGADGTVYFEAITSQYTEDITPQPNEFSDCFFPDGSSTYSWAEQIQLLTLSPSGSLSSQPLDSTGSAGSFEGATRPGHNVGEVIPDGQGGVLASWTFDPQDGSDAPIPLKVADIGSSGAQATLNALDMETSMDNNLVLGDNGMAFATDGNAVVAFDASSLAPIWTYTSQGGDELVAATSDGGLAINDFSSGIAQLDLSGNAIAVWGGSPSLAPTSSWSNEWYVLGARGSGLPFSAIALPMATDPASLWAQPSGDPSAGRSASALCGCEVQPASTPPPPATCPICGLQASQNSVPNCAAFPGSGPSYVLLVGDPGVLGPSGVNHDVGPNFALAAQTVANSLLTQNDNVVACRVSTIEQFTAALEQNGFVSGGTQYFGHSGVSFWHDAAGPHLASELYVGQGSETDTNVTGANYQILTDVRQSNDGQSNLGLNASMQLNGCEAGAAVLDYYTQTETSVAQMISAALQRGVYAYIPFVHFSNQDAATDNTRAGEGTSPSGLPMYMNPDGSPQHRPKLQPFCPSGSCH